MKTLLSTSVGGPEALELADVPSPTLEPGRVLVNVAACALNFPDLLMIQDKYQAKVARPFAPGIEIAGIVGAVGEGVEGLTAGDRVIALLSWGGLAEQVSVEPRHLLPAPPGMPLVEASAFLVPFGTSYFALKQRARLRKGERLLVLGAAGGVGIAAVQLGAAMGAFVVAAVSSPEKGQFCHQQGAQAVVTYPRGPLDSQRQRELATLLKEGGGGGFDVIYDPVGGGYAEPAVRALAPAGRYLVVGFAAGEIPRLPLNLALLKNADIQGVWWGDWIGRNPSDHRENMAELAQLYERGLIRPTVSECFPLHEGAQALRRLESRHALGKVVVTIDGTGDRS